MTPSSLTAARTDVPPPKNPLTTIPPAANRVAAEVERVGPILYYRGCHEDRIELAALVVVPESENPPAVSADGQPAPRQTLVCRDGLAVWRYLFSLPAVGGRYSVDEEPFEVAGVAGGDLRIAYVSCNGQESGDRHRDVDQRNAMWQRLAREHDETPLNLLLHGGDQLYADEMLELHPVVQRWNDGETRRRPDPESLRAAEQRLQNFLFASYLRLYNHVAPAHLLARVPSLCMWDDHDICDGWGSLRPEKLDSPVGRLVFRTAREHFLLFQLGGTPDDLPPICLDRSGASLSWAVHLPGMRIVAPDLRSERRPDRVMGPAGWQTLESELGSAEPGEQLFLLSSVPALGPRLSWVESVLHLLPGVQKYEDDLRDQWQSRAHRDEWRRLLRGLLDAHQQKGTRVTVLSGEIHLATRCTMATGHGPVHQLVASGITHPPPPKVYAGSLGLLARFGEAPLAEHPIRLHPLPAQRGIYAAQRNYLMLERRGGRWAAWWELEDDGCTPRLDLES